MSAGCYGGVGFVPGPNCVCVKILKIVPTAATSKRDTNSGKYLGPQTGATHYHAQLRNSNKKFVQ